jgi:hypothetical protein
MPHSFAFCSLYALEAYERREIIRPASRENAILRRSESRHSGCLLGLRRERQAPKAPTGRRPPISR